MMIGHFKMGLGGDIRLMFFNDFIDKFGHLSAVNTHQMIVVPAVLQFKYRMATRKIMPPDQARGFKLGEHPINRRQTHVFALLQKSLIDIFGG